MEDLAFWRDLELQFSALADRAFDLNASLDDTDLTKYAADLREKLLELRADPSAHPVAIESLSSLAERVRAAADQRTDPEGVWHISWGGSDRRERTNRDAIRNRFESLAARAAVAADLVQPGREPAHAWLFFLKQRSSPFWNGMWIERVCEASALACHELGTAQYALARSGSSVPSATAERQSLESSDVRKALVRQTLRSPLSDAADGLGNVGNQTDEAVRRGRLLEDYRSSAGNPKNKQIYEAANSHIHKPQFYAWLNGKLPSRSLTTRQFEEFLRSKRPPRPRRPKSE